MKISVLIYPSNTSKSMFKNNIWTGLTVLLFFGGGVFKWRGDYVCMSLFKKKDLKKWLYTYPSFFLYLLFNSLYLSFSDFRASFFHEHHWTHWGMLDLWKSKGLWSVQLFHSRKYMRLMIKCAEYIKLNHSAPQKGEINEAGRRNAMIMSRVKMPPLQRYVER